jgi:hypothetical protein
MKNAIIMDLKNTIMMNSGVGNFDGLPVVTVANSKRYQLKVGPSPREQVSEKKGEVPTNCRQASIEVMCSQSFLILSSSS